MTQLTSIAVDSCGAEKQRQNDCLSALKRLARILAGYGVPLVFSDCARADLSIVMLRFCPLLQKRLFQAFSIRAIFVWLLLWQPSASTASPAQKADRWPSPIPLEQAVLPTAPTAPRQRIYAAYSMKVAEQLIRNALADHADFRTNEVLYHLGGINKPKGIIWDDLTRSWILFGEKLIDDPDLTLDDFAVALRARFNNLADDPGVSIDPMTQVFRDSTGGSVTQTAIQKVRFMGPLSDTAFGKTCFDADWLMKRLSLGLEHGPIASLPSTTPTGTFGPSEHVEISDRFWLEPNSELKVFSKRLIAIEQLNVMVRTELLSARNIDGTPLLSSSLLVTEERDDCDRFAGNFSSAYDEIARCWPVYERLRGLARLATLGKGLAILGERNTFNFLISEYQVQTMATPRTVDMVSAWFRPGCSRFGGVVLKPPTVDLQSQIISGSEAMAFVDAIKSAVIGKRLSVDSLTWTIDLDASSIETKK